MKKSRRLSKTSTAEAKAKVRDKYLQTKYGITLFEYNSMLALQSERCAICRKHQSLFKSSLAVDHNHVTGRVRGLMCYYCNHRLVGRHTIESARKIYLYLLKYDVEAV